MILPTSWWWWWQWWRWWWRWWWWWRRRFELGYDDTNIKVLHNIADMVIIRILPIRKVDVVPIVLLIPSTDLGHPSPSIQAFNIWDYYYFFYKNNCGTDTYHYYDLKIVTHCSALGFIVICSILSMPLKKQPLLSHISFRITNHWNHYLVIIIIFQVTYWQGWACWDLW